MLCVSFNKKKKRRKKNCKLKDSENVMLKKKILFTNNQKYKKENEKNRLISRKLTCNIYYVFYIDMIDCRTCVWQEIIKHHISATREYFI